MSALACQDVASKVATTDREDTAYAVVALAIHRATDLYRMGCDEAAAEVMVKAEASATRILGGAS